MISSKTHEIVKIRAFADPVLAFEEVCTKGNKDFLENFVTEIKYVQRIGSVWQKHMNYAWLVSCGFLPWSDSVIVSALPTIDYANYKEYIFARSVYVCPREKERDIVFDYVDHPFCPNCNAAHHNSETLVIRIENMWADFPLHATLKDLSEDFTGIMKKANSLNYRWTRMKYVGE
jgi:hypothetical protein